MKAAPAKKAAAKEGRARQEGVRSGSGLAQVKAPPSRNMCVLPCSAQPR
jgi:hypothetical protein